MKRLLLFAIVAVVAIAGIGVYLRQTDGVQVRTSKTTGGMIQQYVDERGKTRLAHTYEITMPLAGRLQAINCEEGQSVDQGEIVAQMVMDDLKHHVAEAQAAVERLQASITENDDNSVEERAKQQSKAFVESMRHTVAAAEARKTAGAKKTDFAESFYKRTRELESRNAKTLEDLERAEMDFVTSQVDYQQDILVWKASQAMLMATELFPKMIDEYVNRKRLQSAVLQKQLAEATARLDQARLDQSRAAMQSPITGLVFSRNYDDEQFIPAGAVLMTIGNWRDMEVVVDVLSQDATRLRAGGKAKIYGIDGGDTEAFSVGGTIARVDPLAYTKISSLGVEQQRVDVVVRLEPDAVQSLRQRFVGADFRVRVRLITAEHMATAIVPRPALFRGTDGQWELFVIRGGRAARQIVELGLTNDSDAEILSGIQAGEEVVLAPENDVVDGVRILSN